MRIAQQALAYRGKEDWVKDAKCGSLPLEGIDRLREGNIACQNQFIKQYCNHCDVVRECLQDSVLSPHMPNGAAGRMTTHQINRVRAAAAVIVPQLYAISKQGRPAGKA
jgi:hypothetical protein